MSIRPSDLRTVPLFHGITDQHLEELIGVFERLRMQDGDVLFEAGAMPTQFLLLIDGEVALLEDGEPRFRLRPIAPIGELGALTGLKRNATAKVVGPSEIWRVSVERFRDFFEAHGDVAFPFYHNLLTLVADKVRRDERRLDEMRTNLIRTQKAMKRLRELVLEAEETPLSGPIFETLDECIEHNRKIHYMVDPPASLRTDVRLDNGRIVRVLELSDTNLRLPATPGHAPAPGWTWTGVLVTPDVEIPLSGRIERADDEELLIDLDPLIPEYAQRLQDHLTRLQMLDYVV